MERAGELCRVARHHPVVVGAQARPGCPYSQQCLLVQSARIWAGCPYLASADPRSFSSRASLAAGSRV